MMKMEGKDKVNKVVESKNDSVKERRKHKPKHQE
jgi:hypothetical protein